RELPARKDIFLDEISDAAAQALRAGPVVRDAVVQRETTRLQQPLHLRKVARVILRADVLEHADAGDLVVLGFRRQIEKVAELDPHATIQTQRSDLQTDLVVLLA